MRATTLLLVFAICFGCDSSRVYEEQVDFEEKAWIVSDKPTFEFEIADRSLNYNIYYTVRNSLEFPYSRLFVNYTLNDTLQNVLAQDLASAYLFDQKTGEPQGTSSIGDLYDHRFPILINHRFEKAGRYLIKLEQFNRKDTLDGVLAVGIRVEKAQLP
ncbi:MAG: gliding motility lipoprotein GldH [Cyclobacteriaceae bacterium]